MSAKASDAELRHSAVDRLKASFNTISTRKLVKTNFTSHTLPDNAEARVAVACSQLPESLDLGRANTNPVVYNPSKMKLCLLWKPDNPEVSHEEQCYGGKKNTGPSLLQSTSNPSLLLAIWLMKYITNLLVCHHKLASLQTVGNGSTLSENKRVLEEKALLQSQFDVFRKHPGPHSIPVRCGNGLIFSLPQPRKKELSHRPSSQGIAGLQN